CSSRQTASTPGTGFAYATCPQARHSARSSTFSIASPQTGQKRQSSSAPTRRTMHDQPSPTEEEQELAAERLEEEEAARGVGTGDYFGEVALAMQMPRTASVRALTPVTVASCDRETFDEFVRPLFADDE